MTAWTRTQLVLGLVIVLFAGVLAGCTSGESKQGEPVLEGDYTTEPGQAGKAKG